MRRKCKQDRDHPSNFLRASRPAGNSISIPEPSSPKVEKSKNSFFFSVSSTDYMPFNRGLAWTRIGEFIMYICPSPSRLCPLTISVRVAMTLVHSLRLHLDMHLRHEQKANCGWSMEREEKKELCKQ